MSTASPQLRPSTTDALPRPTDPHPELAPPLSTRGMVKIDRKFGRPSPAEVTKLAGRRTSRETTGGREEAPARVS